MLANGLGGLSDAFDCCGLLYSMYYVADIGNIVVSGILHIHCFSVSRVFIVTQ